MQTIYNNKQSPSLCCAAVAVFRTLENLSLTDAHQARSLVFKKQNKGA